MSRTQVSPDECGREPVEEVSEAAGQTRSAPKHSRGPNKRKAM